jgi:C4-dicarboxylate-specific signal transduction histidine kinase
VPLRIAAMLYLQNAAAGENSPSLPSPVAESTAIGLERALLSADLDTRKRELAATLARDSCVADWAIQLAQQYDGAVQTVDDAARQLAPNLESRLAGYLTCGNGPESGLVPKTDVDLRLSALVRRLADYESRLADFDARLEREKLDSLKELAYGASHEINNPLANIAARAQTLLQDESHPERARTLTAIHRQAMRAHEMIADLMLFARPPKLNLARCDLAAIVRGIVHELLPRAQEQNTQLVVHLDDAPIELQADATQLAVAIHAVVKNAFEALGDSGTIQIVARRTEVMNQPGAEVVVRDDGPGISEDVRRHLFDPFFSGREAGRGLGFGLSKCWRIVTDHGGRVIVGQSAEGGAEIAIQLAGACTLGAPSI